ncbi:MULTISPECIES: hypothetical protein [Treponema]
MVKAHVAIASITDDLLRLQ